MGHSAISEDNLLKRHGDLKDATNLLLQISLHIIQYFFFNFYLLLLLVHL